MLNFKMKISLIGILVITLISISPIYAEEMNNTDEAIDIENDDINEDLNLVEETENSSEDIQNAPVVESNKDTSSSEVTATRRLGMYGIADAASRVKNFVDVNGRLPNYVTVYSQTGYYNLSMPDFLYVLAKTTINFNNGIITDIYSNYYYNPTSPTGVSINGQITKANYYAYAQSIVSFMDSNDRAPNYLSTSLGNMQYQTVIYMYSLILAFQLDNGRLPNYVTINIASSHSINNYLPVY